MKQVNFSHPGGFPLEQETLERLQTAYRSELYEAIKRHLSILPDTNYIIAHAQSGKQGWAVIHQDGEGILYPMTATVKTDYSKTDYLKTTKTTTNLIYGSGASQTAYTDYQAEYVSAKETPTTNDTETVNYYDLGTFKTVKSIQEIETIIAGIDGRVKTIEATIPIIDNRVKTIEATLPIIDTRINTIETDLESYLPLDGSKAMKGDLNLGTHQLYLNTLNTATSNDYLLAVNNQNQVVKNSTLLTSLIDRIETLEKRPVTSVPVGMIAIWGKSAPFPEGWEEYVPLRGRMPIGLNPSDSIFNALLNYGGNKEKTLSIDELPPHTHGLKVTKLNNSAGSGSEGVIRGSTESEQTGSTGLAKAFSILNPYRVVQFIEYTGNTPEPVDTTPPTSPTALTASNIGTTTLTLTWNSSTDNIGVTGYLVYKNNSNTPFDELGKDVLTYNVTGLSPNTNYNFQVKAKDAAGNISDPASTNATTAAKVPDITAPTVPSFFHCVHNGQGNIQLEWAPSQDEDSPIQYEVSRNAYGFFTVLDKITNTYYYDKVTSNGTYTYRVRAIDPSGNASDYKEASITISTL